MVLSGMRTELDYNLNPISKFSKKSHDFVPLRFKGSPVHEASHVLTGSGERPHPKVCCTQSYPAFLQEAVSKARTRDLLVTRRHLYIKRLSNEGTNHFPESMDRYLKSHTESVKQTMMRHEEIFQQQVQELHRLYKVQKTLMAELKSKDLKQESLRNVSSENIRDANNILGATHSSYISTRYPSKNQLNQTGGFLQLCNIWAGPSSQKLSICSEVPLRIQKGYGLEQPAVNDGNVRVRQKAANLLPRHLKEEKIMKDSESHSDGESDVELTLSIGGHGDRKKSRKWLPMGNELGCSISKHNEARQLIATSPVRREATEQGNSSEGFSGERLQGPPWLLRSLNLNRS